METLTDTTLSIDAEEIERDKFYSDLFTCVFVSHRVCFDRIYR